MKKTNIFLSFIISLLLVLINSESKCQTVTVTSDGRLVANCPTCQAAKHDTIYLPGPIQYRDTGSIKYFPVYKDTCLTLATNKLPVVNAGNDQSVILPANSVTLIGSASDPDGQIAGYSWSRISGPATFSLTNQFSAVTAFSNLVQGSYTMRLTATDERGGSSFDDITVTVNAAIPIGQTKTLSFIQRTDDYPRQDAGADQWHNGFEVNIWGGLKPLNKYFRFNMSELTNPDGTYNWTMFDKEANGAFANGQRFSFGVMTSCPGCDANRMVSYAGGTAAIPLALHNQMQAEQVKDWKTEDGDWIPNWNSPAYLKYLFDFNKALNDHIITMGWKARIFNIDIRGYGAWGEWHSGGGIVDETLNEYPAGTRASLATLKAIVDAHTKTFIDFPLVAMIAAFDRGFLGIVNNPPEIASYILTQKNNWGLIGWRRDQWGATDAYLAVYLENNRFTVEGIRLDTAIMNRWRYAPIVGEPPGWNVDDFATLITQVKNYHGSQFGNDNYGVAVNANITANVKIASAAAGHRLTLTGGSVTTGSTTTITLNWDNSNRAPTYMNWDVLYQVNGVTIGKSSFNPKWFTGTTTKTDSITGVPTGKLTIKVVDQAAYAKTMTLGITGQNPDGSYTLLP